LLKTVFFQKISSTTKDSCQRFTLSLIHSNNVTENSLFSEIPRKRCY
jgi:hypothetical protein